MSCSVIKSTYMLFLLITNKVEKHCKCTLIKKGNVLKVKSQIQVQSLILKVQSPEEWDLETKTILPQIQGLTPPTPSLVFINFIQLEAILPSLKSKFGLHTLKSMSKMA